MKWYQFFFSYDRRIRLAEQAPALPLMFCSRQTADIGARPYDVRFIPKSGHCIAPQRMSALCQKQTYAPHQLTSYPAPHPRDVIVICRPELATHFCFFKGNVDPIGSGE